MTTNAAGTAGPTLRHFALLILLSIAWGTAFLFIKIALASLTPETINLGRMGVAALALFLLIRYRRLALPPMGIVWAFLTAVAILGNTLPYWLIAVAEKRVDSGLASILIGATPLVTMVMAHFATHDERLTPQRILGFCLGFAGLVVLFGPKVLAGIGEDLIAQSLLLLACVSFSLNALVARRMPPVAVAISGFGMCVIGTAIMFPFAVASTPVLDIQPGLPEIAAIVGLGVISTAAATLLFFTLVREVGATFVVSANYLTPLVALTAGVLLLGERPEADALIAFALICGGIWLANRPSR
jgi:drug/metabolite transporter (DMT)-like permease